MLGHRGLTHSFFFAMALSGLVVLLFFSKPVDGMMSRLALFAFFFVATASHSITPFTSDSVVRYDREATTASDGKTSDTSLLGLTK